MNLQGRKSPRKAKCSRPVSCRVCWQPLSANSCTRSELMVHTAGPMASGMCSFVELSSCEWWLELGDKVSQEQGRCHADCPVEASRQGSAPHWSRARSVDMARSGPFCRAPGVERQASDF